MRTFIIIVIAVVILIWFKSRDRSRRRNPPNNSQRTVLVRDRMETGPMVYFANDRHGRKDRVYQFNYKQVNGTWRAYILETPNFDGRDSTGVATHRMFDHGRPYVCWKNPVTSLRDMQTISKAWADNIQEYIATGKRFG